MLKFLLTEYEILSEKHQIDMRKVQLDKWPPPYDFPNNTDFIIEW